MALKNLLNTIQSVWQMYMIHGGNYTEPKYEQELSDATDALAQVEQPQAPNQQKRDWNSPATSKQTFILLVAITINIALTIWLVGHIKT